MINKKGFISLKRISKNKTKNLFPHNECIHHNYHKENEYKMNIKYDLSSNEIITYVNELQIFKIADLNFINSQIGFMSSNKGTIFTQLLSE